MQVSTYSDYTTANYLEDDYFVQWVIAPTEESNRFFNAVLEAYPQSANNLVAAADFIRVFRLQQVHGHPQQQASTWQRIRVTVAQDDAATRIVPLPWKKLAIAATFLLMAGSTWIWYRLTPVKIATRFGEIKTVLLPDSSMITLNGNSSISYSRIWNPGKPREVWLEGECFFDVKHLNKDTLHIEASERFVVHSGDVNVEVLGTSFNIKNRHEKTNIGLVTGKIRVDYNLGAKQANSLVMEPGDYIEYQGKRITVNKKVKPVLFKRWIDYSISLTDATLRDVKETLEDNFGYKVEVKDSSLLQQKIEGDINVKSVQELMDILSTTLNINVYEIEGRLVFSYK
ncbi:FecR family protein [Chitinophaga skermanii]|uniref:FecR family protein n=1 Tax=Chitinophaga skermanii TaxID=331697 RepID=A0A327QX58_9BACT|nr:FecR domain-containing protein [Chitinophaga skermanii]RAJ08921.1 FecR family protein [Chitinophaga skermanii]